MIIPKNLLRLTKSHTSGGRSRHSQLIFQSSSIAQSSSTGPWRKASSSAVRTAGAWLRSFDHSGLPVKRSASHQTSPASSASRSVSDIDGKTPRAQEKIGLVMKSRREEVMGSPLFGGAGHNSNGINRIRVNSSPVKKDKLMRWDRNDCLRSGPQAPVFTEL